MSQFVVDNSVVMAWAFEDEVDDYAARVLASLAAANAFVPAIWPLEVANVLAVAERRKRLTTDETDYFLATLAALPVTVIADADLALTRHLLSLARDHGLSSYDASYLALAIKLGLPLATQDRLLRLAARKAGVPSWLN